MEERFPSQEKLVELVSLLRQVHDEAGKLDLSQRPDWNWSLRREGDPFIRAWYRMLTLLEDGDFNPPLGWPDELTTILEDLRGFQPAFERHRKKALYVLKHHIDGIRSVLSRQAMAELAVGDAATLRDRLELILTVFDKDNPGPLSGKTIAKLSRLNYDSHFRADLSELKSLGFLKHNGQGYTRTDKPYPMS